MVEDAWIGKKLGSYTILRLLGKGGSGRVYRARHAILEREAAIKLLNTGPDSTDEHYQSFLREARTIAQMRHPHVVQLFDFGYVHDTHYMVMEYIPGNSLQTKLEEARSSDRLLPGVEVWRIIKQMGEALTYIHERGVIHRDIKPGNILLTQEGNIVISDFGVARLLAGFGDTTTGTITGTPAYMSPEQALGQSIDHRADLYSMAIIVYEMLAGHVPFSGATPLAVILTHLNQIVPPLRQTNQSVPPHVEQELLKAMSKLPENRHQSVANFLQALARASRTIHSEPLPASTNQPAIAVGPDGKECIHIPDGEFWMGDSLDNDAPSRKVYTDGFYISRHPVTNAEYLAFVEATGYKAPEHWQDGLYASWEANHPVVYVKWHDAAAYCRWAKGRLPSEAEWEKAARGTDKRKYPWGNTFDASRCNSREGGIDTTSTVGDYSPAGDSPYGVSDLSGNVWEWVLDWSSSAPRESALARNPMGPAMGKTKVIRGGSFYNNENLVTCYARDHALPNVAAVNYGFRVRLSEEVFGRATARTSAPGKLAHPRQP